MGCPQCQWNTLTFLLETRQWICKRCKHEWKEKAQPMAGNRKKVEKPGKRKASPSKIKKKGPKKKTGGAKKRRSASRK
jgi:hypothetical protein